MNIYVCIYVCMHVYTDDVSKLAAASCFWNAWLKKKEEKREKFFNLLSLICRFPGTGIMMTTPRCGQRARQGHLVADTRLTAVTTAANKVRQQHLVSL